MPNTIQNGDFAQGLSGWHVVSGSAFAGQPVAADSILAGDVHINGQPAVTLGGNYWWNVPYCLAEKNTHLVRVNTDSPGILDSDVFTINQPYLAFRLGGSASPQAALELRVPAANAAGPGFPALDHPDPNGFVAVRIQQPAGSDVLHQYTWNLAGSPASGTGLLGSTAKVRLRIQGSQAQQLRLAAAQIRLLPEPPAPSHLPVWGWADIHCHPMSQAGFGGLMAGQLHGPVEDLGSCLHAHGAQHSNPLHLLGAALDSGARNDGSLDVPGWTVGTPSPGDELGFQAWPAFDDLIHIRTHQAWIRRAYDGGLRLMVALVVHNELLAVVGEGTLSPQSDRDVIEPQVAMLQEFIVHNHDWCGLAKTPTEARALIEQNKLAFVLGLETDSVNGWVYPPADWSPPWKVPFAQAPSFDDADTPANRAAIQTAIRPYFEYLRHTLGIVHINLVHLSDNAFGGMALYDLMFVVNTFYRTGRAPETEDGYIAGRTNDEQISRPVSLASALWEKIGAPVWDTLTGLASPLGVTLPQVQPGTSPILGHGDRNHRGLTVAGKVAVAEAMRLGMIIDMDHMSERSAADAFDIVRRGDPVQHQPYPLISAHSGARKLSPRPLAKAAPAAPGYRRNPETWPSEGSKSETQLDYIIKSGLDRAGVDNVGIFGHGTAIGDTLDCPYGSKVANDCPGTVKSLAQGYEYVAGRLKLPVALGTDLNVLLAGPGPRFGPTSAQGLKGEIDQGDAAWQAAVRLERLKDAEKQATGVHYATHLRDWRAYRFKDDGLYDDTPYAHEGHLMWQALALYEAVSTHPPMTVADAKAQDPTLDQRVIDMAVGMGLPGPQTASDYYIAGRLMDNWSANLSGQNAHVLALVEGLRKIQGRWQAMSGDHAPLSRCTAGPLRDYDFNLDGLAHYGLLPDMLQDLKNVGLSDSALASLFGSAEGYLRVWERCAAVGARM